MWAPASAPEVDQALAADTLTETLVMEGKTALPDPRDPRKSLDIAIDVSAFANSNGGVLLYGVGEDANRRLTGSTPIPLAGAPERIDQIVRSGIAEAPDIEIRPLPLTPGASAGYLSVIVPPSPRAPHMVVVDREHRYYGRSATGNYRMSEAEVARLYERRARLSADRDTLLRDAVASAATNWPKDSRLAYLYVVVRPVMTTSSFLDTALPFDDPQCINLLHGYLVAAGAVFPQGTFGPDLIPGNRWERRGLGWRTGQFLSRPQMEHTMSSIADLEVRADGSAVLFCGNAGQTVDMIGPNEFDLNEILIAGLATRTLAVLGLLYQAARYYGAVDVGIAVTGLRGGEIVSRRHITSAAGRSRNSLYTGVRFDEDYYRTVQVTAQALIDKPAVVARDLVMPIITSVARDYDPFQALNVLS